MNFKNYLKIVLLCILSLNYSCNSDDNVPVMSSENRILSFTLTKDAYTKQFSIGENSIEGNVATNIELTGINLDITISENASITPNPSTITSITGPFTFTVTAKNGDVRVYNIDINRDLKTGNSILNFRIDTETFSTSATVIQQSGIIYQRLPEDIDLTNLNVTITLSDGAILSPDIDSMIDFSTPVSLIVTSESGLQKTYNVNISHMSESFSKTCNKMNVSKWFGGDNRANLPPILPYDRNVGTGQIIYPNQDISPSSFSIHLGDGFKFYEGNIPYNEAVELKLNIRKENGEILTQASTTVPGDFNEGFILFDFENQVLFLEENTKYIFQWYLVNGDVLGVMSSSPGNNNETASGFCFGGGFSGESKISQNTSLEDFSTWWEHGWNFNIKLEGKQ